MQNILRSIWKEFVYGGHLLAFGLVGIVTVSALLLNIRITWDFAVIIYSLSLAPCLFGRYVDLKKDALTNPERSKYLQSRASVLPYFIALIVLVMMGIILYFGKYSILLFSLALASLSFLYDLSLKKLTRKIPGFKNLFVSLLFTLLSVMLVLYYSAEFNISTFIVLIFIYLMIFIGTSFSDIKDIKGDKEEGLKTLAVVLGHKNLLFLFSLVTVLATINIIAGVYLKLIPIYGLMLIFAAIYNFILFKWSRKKGVDMDFLTNVVCDGQLILWPILVFIGKVIIK